MWKTETKDISSLNYYNYDGKQWTEIGRDAHFRNNIINSILDMLSLLSEEIYNRQLYMVSVSIVYCVYDGRSQKKKKKDVAENREAVEAWMRWPKYPY